MIGSSAREWAPYSTGFDRRESANVVPGATGGEHAGARRVRSIFVLGIANARHFDAALLRRRRYRSRAPRPGSSTTTAPHLHERGAVGIRPGVLRGKQDEKTFLSSSPRYTGAGGRDPVA